MKFIAEPNLLVKFAKPIGLLKYIKFNEKGEYETSNELIVKKLLPHFSAEKHKCKYCGEFFNQKGDLLVHYRRHKEETK